MKSIRYFLSAVLVAVSVQAVDAAIPELSSPDGNPIVLGNKRITLITPTLFRLEYAENQEFLDRPTLFAANRDSLLSPDRFTVTTDDGGQFYRISTGKVDIEVKNDNMPFSYFNIKVFFKRLGKDIKINGIASSAGNLGGSVATLDAQTGEIPLQDGLLSNNGWYYIVDTGNEYINDDDWFDVRGRNHIQDEYCFVYGDDFHAPFRDLGVISGHVPMTRKYMHGIWYSRWYRYDVDYIKELIQGYKDNDFPLDILSIDMDWHTQNHKDGIGHAWTYGWTGHTWNRELIPDPGALIASLKADRIYTCVNEHPHDGIRPADDCYDDFMRAMGREPDGETCLLYDAGDKKYMTNYLEYSRRENRSFGIDFWWVDWQQDYVYPYVRGSNRMPHLPWLNRLYFNDTKRDNMRGAGYSRWGGWGDHRNPIHFSGDADSNWAMLAFEVKLSQTSGNQGCYYWAHDIGGFFGQTNPELLARWSQFGALSAALRVHAVSGPNTDRRPWLWGDTATVSMRNAYHFRSEMMPYIYSSVRKTHETMIPLNRAMYVDYPTDSAAYDRYGQFLFGDLLIAAPITSPGSGPALEASQRVWFPSDSRWWDYFTDEEYAAGSETVVTKDIFSFPVFVRGGNVLPMQPYTQRPGSEPLGKLVMRVYPGIDGSDSEFILYEDDGVSQDYERGAYAKTALRYSRRGDKSVVTVAPAVGNYQGQLPERAYRLELAGFGTVSGVRVDGRKVKTSIENGRTVVDIPKRSITNPMKVEFTHAEH